MQKHNTTQISNERITALSEFLETSTSLETVYRELEEIPVQRYDLIDELNVNLRQLEEMQNKLSFVMRDIRSVMKI